MYNKILASAIVLIYLSCVVYAQSLGDMLKTLNDEQLQDFCDELEHPRHALFQPLRCASPDEDYGAVGKKFKASHNIKDSDRDPVILLPGLGASGLDAEIHKNNSVAWYCFKNLDWFHLWFAVEEILVQGCWMDNLHIQYDPVTGLYNNTYGVNIRPTDFGGVKGVSYLDYKLGIPVSLTSVYSNMVASLQEVGYTVGQDLRGAPYDWRLPADYQEKIGWYQALQELIEETYTLNGNKPVVIVTHSMGGPTALYFLNNYVTPQWLDQYVKSFMPIAGPWSGAPNALRAVLSGDNFGLSFLGIDIVSKKKFRDVARGAGGVVELLPNPDVNKTSTVFVSTPTKNYTIDNFDELFADFGTPSTQPIYKDVDTVLLALHAPQIPVYCLYGYGIATEIAYSYPSVDDQPVIDDSDLGDGTVPLYSLKECMNWDKQQKEPVTIETFNLVGHSDMLHAPAVIEYVLSIVTNQNSTSSKVASQL
eukprot:TRINITY_DN389_c0_g1_i2.p1 TRINITY_DN389_c0_g1~~TRINITY_DN389_c0_g1_i2.p1  ORF type:complete len:477 (+),score=122.76 TRINITY_DN389_c0_g1_i2:95-1525(+)